MVPAVGPVPSLWRANRRQAGADRPGLDRALAAAGQPKGIRLPHRAVAAMGAGPPGDAGSPTGAAGRSHRPSPTLLRSDPVDQLLFAFAPSPGLGHNHPPDAVDPIDGLNTRLADSHNDLVARFRDLELG